MRSQPKTPFFLIGNARSGTSLLRLMLNTHPDIVVPPECGFAMWLRDRYVALDLCDSAVIARFAGDVSASRKFETWNLSETQLRRRLEGRRYAEYPELVAEVYAAYAELRGKTPTLFGDKNNYYITLVDQLRETFPDSLIIHLVRDGRDVACSYLDLADREIDCEYRPNLAFEINEIAVEWSKNCLRMARLTGPRVITLRYEDLLGAPKTELKRMCKFLGAQFDPIMLDFFRWNDEPQSFLQWKGKTREPLDPENAGRFRYRLTQEQISIFQATAAEALIHFDYPLEMSGKR